MSAVRSLVASKGKVIFQPGQSCPGFIVLSKGSIKVTLTGSSGREVVLYRVRPGEVCLQTLSCLINDQPYGAEGVAETEVAGQLVPASDFHKKLAEDEVFRDRILSSVAKRFAEYQQLVEEIALTSFDARLANVLLRMVGPSGVVATTHAALATETASGRAYVTRKLAEFAKKGWVKQKDDGIEILNLRELEQVAAGLR